MADHTPEPWGTDQDSVVTRNEHGVVKDVLYGGDYQATRNGKTMGYDEKAANARRIVACVNACQGIPIEALEDGTVGDAIALLHNINDLADRGTVRPPRPIWEELVRIHDRLKGGEA